MVEMSDAMDVSIEAAHSHVCHRHSCHGDGISKVKVETKNTKVHCLSYQVLQEFDNFSASVILNLLLHLRALLVEILNLVFELLLPAIELESLDV